METATNKDLQLAFDFVQYTNRSIFLTGKAGTGKTTFLKSLKLRSPKRMIVVAPTGVAAINAGVLRSIHSFNCPSARTFLHFTFRAAAMRAKPGGTILPVTK